MIKSLQILLLTTENTLGLIINIYLFLTISPYVQNPMKEGGKVKLK